MGESLKDEGPPLSQKNRETFQVLASCGQSILSLACFTLKLNWLEQLKQVKQVEQLKWEEVKAINYPKLTTFQDVLLGIQDPFDACTTGFWTCLSERQIDLSSLISLLNEFLKYALLVLCYTRISHRSTPADFSSGTSRKKPLLTVNSRQNPTPGLSLPFERWLHHQMRPPARERSEGQQTRRLKSQVNCPRQSTSSTMPPAIPILLRLQLNKVPIDEGFSFNFQKISRDLLTLSRTLFLQHW